MEKDSENRFPHWAERNVGTYKNSEFRLSDINSFLNKVIENGGKIISEPAPKPWGDMAAEFADPDGNIFLISQKIKK